MLEQEDKKGCKETSVTLGVCSVDRCLWRQMGKKKGLSRENDILKSKAELGTEDFDSGGVFEDVEQESRTIRYLFWKDNIASSLEL